MMANMVSLHADICTSAVVGTFRMKATYIIYQKHISEITQVRRKSPPFKINFIVNISKHRLEKHSNTFI